MKNTIAIRPKEAAQIPEPPIARFLFADTRHGLVLVDRSLVCWV
jgi:hypothetical protein